jgi:hypothetical protein
MSSVADSTFLIMSGSLSNSPWNIVMVLRKSVHLLSTEYITWSAFYVKNIIAGMLKIYKIDNIT